jgi:type IV pilus assembly protein PilA
MQHRQKKGFTLLEILLVIGIIAVLATVVIVSLDPATRFRNARDARRLSDIESILSAVHQYIVDNRGALPPGIDTAEKELSTAGSGCSLSTSVCSVSDCVDLSTPLAKYLKTVPYDPANGSEAHTHYAVQADENGIITVRACDSDDSTIASVSR